MDIANPIYDVVFRYLMDDNRAAKLIISAIIGQTIETLEFRTTEKTVRPKGTTLTVHRLDFSASVRTEEGELRKILIELQKAKFPHDIIRFRRYVGREYQNPENHETRKIGKKNTITVVPLITIYLLGYPLDHTDSPVVKINRKYIDVVTGEEILKKEDFIESLTHDSFVVQIPYIKNKRRHKLLRLLSIFDQSRKVERGHFLRFDEAEYPEEYRRIVRRLQKAIAEPEIRETMELEDELLADLEDKEREVFEERAAREEAQAKAEKERIAKEEAQAKAEEAQAKAEEAQAKAEEVQAKAEKAFKEVERLTRLLEAKSSQE